MSLLVSKVPRALETKTRLFGYELGDLLVIFLYLAMSNLVFGATPLKLPLVWIATLALAAGLFFVKRGKAEGYLQHLLQFALSPAVLSAAVADTDYQPLWPLVNALTNLNEVKHAKS